jgi:hypothetical protein
MTQPLVFGEIEMHLADPSSCTSFLTKVWFDGTIPKVVLEPQFEASALSLHPVNARVLSSVLKDAADSVQELTGVASSTIRRLPVMTLCGSRYYLDERLHQLRLVERPEVTIDLPHF